MFLLLSFGQQSRCMQIDPFGFFVCSHFNRIDTQLVTHIYILFISLSVAVFVGARKHIIWIGCYKNQMTIEKRKLCSALMNNSIAMLILANTVFVTSRCHALFLPSSPCSVIFHHCCPVWFLYLIGECLYESAGVECHEQCRVRKWRTNYGCWTSETNTVYKCLRVAAAAVDFSIIQFFSYFALHLLFF